MYKTQVSLLKRPRILGYRKSGAPIWSVGGAAEEDPLERIERRQREIAAELEVLNEEMDAEPDGTPEQRSAVKSERETRWQKLSDEFDKNEAEDAALRAVITSRETRSKKLADARAKWGSVQAKPGTDNSDLFHVDMRSAFATGREGEKVHRDLASRAMKALEDQHVQRHLLPEQLERISKVLRTKNGDLDGQLLSAYLLATSAPAYRSAFQKATGSLHPVFEGEEGRAVSEVQALQRAMSVGTNGAGGFAVPVVIDPTIIMTAQGSQNPILARARVETITNNVWKGLASAGTTWKFDAEAAPSNDNSPTIAQPVVPAYRADGFIPFSIEIGQDWPGFAEDMSMMLARGYDELLADKLTNGTGANIPTGLLTRLLAQTTPQVWTPTTTAAVVSTNDIYKMWARLPQRHRGKTTTNWMSSTGVQSAIRQLGSVDPNFGIGIMQGPMPTLLGHDFPMNDYMGDIPTTPATAATNLAVVGDFKGYLVAQRAGMSIEFVPMLFDATNNRPTGQRGWFAYARVGADVVDPTAFQLLVNKTS